MLILTDTKIRKLIDVQTLTNATVEGDSVNNAGYRSMCFLVSVGAISSGGDVVVYLEHSEDDATFYEIADSAIRVGDDSDNLLISIECPRYTYQYVRPVVTTTLAAIDCCIAIQNGASMLPVTQSNDDLAGAILMHNLTSGDSGYGYGYAYGNGVDDYETLLAIR